MVQQWSILGSLLFTIQIYDLFIEDKKEVNVSSYADNTTSFITGLLMSFEQIILESESILLGISQWFMSNNLKANAAKFHFFSQSIWEPNDNSWKLRYQIKWC